MPDNVFINPYTFVPFPDAALDRTTPHGHAVLAQSPAGAQRYMGRIDLTVEALTRVLVRGGSDGDPVMRDGQPIIPGSSLHGALRSMHESLVGGCLRVFDGDFIPSYRDAARVGVNSGWILAVVEEVEQAGPDTGRPTRLTVCRQQAIARTEVVSRQTERELLRTGTRLAIDGEPVERNGRLVFPSETPMAEDAEGPWVMLLSDGNARSAPAKATRPGIPYYVSLGKLDGGQEVVTTPTRPAVSDDAWESFQFSARGSRDFVEAVRGTKESTLRAAEVGCAVANWQALSGGDPHRISWAHGDSPVTKDLAECEVHVNESPERKVGVRAPHRPWTFPGLPVWVRTARDGSVSAMKLAQIWRHPGGSAPAGKRIPSSLRSCEDASDLCPSCRVFGAADTSGRDEDQAAAQDSYRGHVRVGDLVPVDDVALEPLTLAPMGAPRPGSGQFYLRTPAGTPLRANTEEAALREWGSAADRTEARRLRGRKAYWRTTDRSKHPRWRARPEQEKSKMASQARAFPVGTRFTATVAFDGLTAAEIGALLSCLEPGRVLSAPDEGKEVVLSIGGGKPFGFGACRTTATLSEVHDARSRWLDGEAPSLTTDDAVAAFVASAPVAQSTWPALAIACTLDHVDPELVWYPPGASWDKVGTEEFDKGYEFWSESVGRGGSGKAQTKDKPLIQLPAITDPRQELPIVAKPQRGGRG